VGGENGYSRYRVAVSVDARFCLRPISALTRSQRTFEQPRWRNERRQGFRARKHKKRWTLIMQREEPILETHEFRESTIRARAAKRTLRTAVEGVVCGRGRKTTLRSNRLNLLP
jgi:hypothetical protein